MSNKGDYTKICEDTRGIPVFMQPWWLDVVCKQWDVAIARKGDMVTGLWAYPIETKMGVSIIRSPLLTPYLGPHVIFPGDIKDSNRDSFEYETVAELMKQLPPAKVWHLAIKPGVKQVGLFKTHKLRPQVQQTFLLALDEDEETLLANMKETMRRNIRIAGKDIEVSSSVNHLKDLYQFQKETLKRKGKNIPFTLRQAVQMMEACIANDAGTLWVAKEGKTVHAIVWQVWDDTCSYYFMGGQNPDTNSYKAMSILLWHAMKEARARGNKIFDLEGSMDEGVERFFRNFGGNKALYIVLQRNDSLLWKMKKMLMG